MVQVTGPTTIYLETYENNRWNTRERFFADENTKEAPFRLNVEKEVLARLRLLQDALEEDNIKYLYFEPSRQTHVAVVNGNPRPEPIDDAAYFVLSALQSPQFETVEWPVERLSTLAREASIDAIILLDTGTLPQKSADLLKTYVENGGGLIIGVGDTFSQLPAKTARAPIQALLPGAIRGIRSAEKDQALRIKKTNEDTLFYLTAEKEVYRHIIVDASRQADVLLTYNNNLPALLSYKIGKGNVLLWTSSLSRSWATLPISAGFPAFVQTLVNQVKDSSQKQALKFLEAPVGARLNAEDISPKSTVLTGVKTLENEPLDINIAGNRLTLPSTSGVWKVAHHQTGGKTSNTYVVTVGDSREFRLQRLDEKKIESKVDPLKIIWPSSVNQTSETSGRTLQQRSEATAFLTWAVLLALFLETLLSGRMPRKTLGVIFVVLSFATQSHALGVKSHIQIAQVKTEGNVPYRNPFGYLFQKLPTMTNIEIIDNVSEIRLKDSMLFDFPFYIGVAIGLFSHYRTQKFSESEIFYLLGDFFFLMMSSVARIAILSSRYDDSLRVFPDSKLKPLDSDHAIFRSYFLLDRPTGRKGRGVILSGINLEHRTALVYFNGDLGGALAQDRSGAFVNRLASGHFQRTLALRLGINLIYYALTLDYKKDQIHIPFILKRRGS